MTGYRQIGRVWAGTALALLGACFTISPAIADTGSAPRVATSEGVVEGTSDEGIVTFKGIRYAAPPVGKRRWTPPAPAEPWEGVRSADSFGPGCIQPEVPATSIYNDPPPSQSEDCLNLNIWAPEDAQGAPVIVWIHGGSLRIGANSLKLYDGREFARRGIVFVSINYRLGALGWMAHRQLSAESPIGISGNYGLLDQIAALRWVRANAAAFGGDPANVTIMGESAGALSATYLLASPPARGLFARAIIQSTSVRSFPELSRRANGLHSAESIGEQALRAMGARSIADARALNAHEVVNRTTFAGFPSQGTIDGKLLPRQLIDSFDQGEQARIPIIVGFNGDEIRTQRVLLPKLPGSEAEYVRQIESAYGDLAPDFLRLYPAADEEVSALAALRDGIYGWSGERLARSQAQLGVPSYIYVFDHCYPTARARDLCGFHASELPFVFGNMTPGDVPQLWPLPDGAEDRALSDAMLDYWTSFARDGTPSIAQGPAWQPYAPEEKYMLFDSKPQARQDPFPGMFELHEGFAAHRRSQGKSWGLAIGLGAANEP